MSAREKNKGKQSRREQALAVFRQAERDYLCPVCQENLILTEDGSFQCKKGHCFDLSAKGHVNFVPNQKPVNYSRELFENRKRVFDDGFYDAVIEELSEVLGSYAASHETPVKVLDVGCGEGYYSIRFTEEEKLRDSCRFYAMDLSKDAILLAARSSAPVGFMVADLAHLPWKRKRIGVLLNILTPANYAEYFRVLAEDGILAKVIPGEHYLKEVRQAASAQLLNKAYDNTEVLSYFEEHAELLERRTVLTELSVNQEQAEAFLRMTPMTYHVDLSKVDAGEIRRITIHLEILIGCPKKSPLTRGGKKV